MSRNTSRVEKLLEAVPDALIGMDQQGVIRFVNRQSELLFGYDRDQLVGQPITTLVPETLWQIYTQHRHDYFQDPRTRSSALEVELSGRHHNGGQFPIHVSMSHIDTGDVLLVITGAGDVITRAAAVRNAGLVEALVKYADDAIIGVTLEGTITSWNPGAERLYGYSSQEIIGRSLAVLLPEDRGDELARAAEEVRAGQHVAHLETTRVRKDGTLVPVSITFAPIRDEDGTVVGGSSVHRDVTAQRQGLQAAQSLAAIIEGSDDAIIGRTLDGTITSWNPAAATMFGYTREEIIGRPADLLIPQEHSREARKVAAQVSAGQLVQHLETTRVRKDGTVFPVSITLSPIRDTDGTVVGASVIYRDTTEQVQAARAVEHARDTLQATMDSLLDPHVLLKAVRDPGGQIVDFVLADANPAACAYNRIPYQDLVGSRLLDLQPGTVGYGLLDQYRQVVQSGEPLVLDDFAYAQELLGGRERRYDVRAVRVGERLSYTWRDVTERHAAAAWLAESQEHFRLLAENASDVVMALSADRRYQWVSGSIADVLGWPAPALLERVIDEFIHPEDLAVFQDAVAVAGPGSTAHTEFRFRRQDGSYRRVLCHMRPKVDQHGGPVGMFGGLVDIQARKEVEARDKDRLASLERFERLAVGRELKMIELKKEIERLTSLVHGADADPR